MCFDVFNEFRGVKNGWHGDTPCLRMLPIGYGGCLLRSIQYGGTGAASGEGQSSMCVLSSLQESIPHHGAKEKLIVFIKIRKKSNGEERMAPGVRAAVEVVDVSVCTSSLLIRRGDTKALPCQRDKEGHHPSSVSVYLWANAAPRTRKDGEPLDMAHEDTGLGDFFLRTGPSLDGTLCLESGR